MSCSKNAEREFAKGLLQSEGCVYCHEPILPGERIAEVEGPPLHYECGFRMVCGSVGHQENQCPCHGIEDHSEDGMTLREGAKAALAHGEKKAA